MKKEELIKKTKLGIKNCENMLNIKPDSKEWQGELEYDKAILASIESQPQVTDELIEEKVKKLASLLDNDEAIRMAWRNDSVIKDFIRQLYEEIPVKKPRVSTEFVKKNRKLLILLIAKMEKEKLLDWTDEGTSLKILEANFENFIKQILTEAGVEVIE